LFAELVVLQDGTFHSVIMPRRTGNPATTQAADGHVTEAQLTELRRSLAKIKDESGISDARSLSFRWVDEDGQIQMRRCIGGDDLMVSFLKIVRVAAPGT
jgi:hypothetical protein